MRTIKKVQLPLLTLGLALVAGQAFANDSNAKPVGSGSPFAGNAGAIAAATKVTNSLIFQYDPNVPQIISVNSAQQQSRDNSNALALTTSQSAVNSQLSQLQEFAGILPDDSDQTGYSAILNNVTTNLQGSDTIMIKSSIAPPANLSDYTQDHNTANLPPANISTNFNSLFTPLNLGKNGDLADNFVNLLAKTYQPLVDGKFQQALRTYVEDIKSNNGDNSKNITILSSDPNYLSFQADLRSYVANQSIAIGNLNHLFAERQPQSDGKTQLPSTLEADQTMYTRRVHSAPWYHQMESASPATVQRETLFVLAEIENELFQQRLVLERILATNSATLLSNSEINKSTLKIKESEVEKDITKKSQTAEKEQQNQQQAIEQQAEQQVKKQK